MDSSDDRPGHTRADRVAMWACLFAVMAGAFYASYIHALAVCRAADGPGAVAFVVAGLADPTICAASVNISAAVRRGQQVPRWPVAAAAVAVAVTLVMNVAAHDPRAVPAWLVNAWVPVALGLTLESIISFTRRGRDAARPEGSPGVPAAQIQPAAAAPAPTREWLDGHLRAFAEELTPRELETALGVSRGRIRSAMTAGSNGDGPDA